MYSHARILTVLLSALTLSLGVPAFAVVYVDFDAAGPAHDGNSWGTAYLTIQAGVSDPRAPAQDVWVATDNYNENVNITVENVAVLGGFDPDPLDPDPLGNRVLGSSIVTPLVTSTSVFQATTGTILDGFTISGGLADLGAAVKSTGTSLIVQNCTISGNHARMGAGLYATAGYMAAKLCTFTNNTARDTFANPGIAEGGAIWGQNCTLAVSDCTFTNQIATVSEDLITGPTARGGAIFSQGGGVRVERSIFNGCSATGSTATHYAYGGALFSSTGAVYLASNFFIRCSALGTGDTQTSYGGAVAILDPTSLNIRNNTFAENVVTPNAGVLNDWDRPYGYGAAIYATGVKPAAIINNIIARSRGTAVYSTGLAVTFNYNLVWRNAGGDIHGFHFPVPDPSKGIVDANVMKDPQFRLIDNIDYHITLGSAAIDAGTSIGAPSLDIDGENRLPSFDGKVDIGADEFIDSNHDGGADKDPRPPAGDPDFDTIFNPYDNAPGTPNLDQLDSNGDGLGDAATIGVVVFYVDGSVATSGDGTTWADAFKTIQEGITAADMHNAVGWTMNPPVWVRGTDDLGDPIVYLENIVIWHGVRVYGGWAGTESPATPDVYSSRNVSAQPVGDETAIDGGAAGPVVIIAQLPQDRYITNPTVKLAYDLAQPVINGFTLTNGLAELGGGVSIYKETANVSVCRINENTAALGGGVYIYESTGIVGDGIGPLPGNILNLDTTISDNTATGVEDYAGFGGGVYAEQGSPMLFANIITGNHAFFGGGIAARESSPIIVQNQIGCKLNQNVAEGTSTSDGHGGGVYFWFADGILDKDTIVWNEASGPAGRGGGIWADTSDFRLKSSILAYNVAVEGGAVWADFSFPLITYTCFFDNGADPYHGIGNPLITPTNFEDDPLFVEPDDCDYHLELGSPCIEAGDPSENPGTTPPNMGAFQDVDPIVTIGQAKLLDTGVTAVIQGVIVTAVFSDSIYVEQVDRAAGIKVRMTRAKVSEGQMVEVTGVIAILGNEKQLVNARITGTISAASELRPLGMSIKRLGMGSGGVGVSSIGLLIRTWGRVKEIVEGDSPVIVMEDGSGCVANVHLTPDASVPEKGELVVVTGVSSVDTGSNGEQVRAVRTRRGSDLTRPQR